MKINTEKLTEIMSRRLETNETLAKKTGLSVGTISRIRNGREPRVSTLRKLTEALECSIEDLI